MGATSSGASLLRGLGLALSSSSSGQQDSITPAQWNNHHVKTEDTSVAAGLGLGLSSGGNSGLTMGQSSLFGTKPTTLDFLGLGMGPGCPSGFTALFNSMGGGLEVAGATSYGGRTSPRETWEGPSDRKPNASPALL